MEYSNYTVSNFVLWENMTDEDFLNPKNHLYPKKIISDPLWEVAVKITIYCVLILTSLVGNTLVILVVYRNKRMQTTTNYFIVNLAVCDIFVTVSCAWVHLVDDLTEGWILGSFFCKFNSFAQVTSLVSSILSLTLVAIDRFFGIVYAMKAHIIERKAKPFLIIVWLVSISVATPVLIYRKVYIREWKDHVEMWCDDGEWPMVEKGPNDDNITMYYSPGRIAYWTCISLILFTLPIFAMIGAYCGIIKTLWKTKQPGERISKDNGVQNKMKRKVIIMLITILAVFGICWCPLQISILFSEYKPSHVMLENWYVELTFCAKLLAFSNSALNPLIYAGFNENFRKGICSLFGCYKKRRWIAMARIDSFRSTTVTTTKI